uniref:Reverse transcriptase Ty1/copia-type domain-containing protein n=1 Tax=Physcomitrium patens TaxID=3218 RepID=A0A2K1JZR9_PHYPA|nr:hypothetical protein PHYPA_014138 [Physcomitrium patens]
MSIIPYANIICSLMYAILCTTPNISFEVSMDTLNFSILFDLKHERSEEITYIVNIDFVKDLNKKRSPINYVFVLVGRFISKYMAISKEVHIDVRHHYIKDIINSIKVYLNKINIHKNARDMLTKLVIIKKFIFYLNLLNIRNI